MAAITSGADPDRLDELAREMTGASQQLRAMQGRLTARVEQVAWSGRDADRVRGEWMSRHARAITVVSTDLETAATVVVNNATDQRQASAGIGGGLALNGAGAPGIPGPPPPPPVTGGAGPFNATPMAKTYDAPDVEDAMYLAAAAAGAAGFTHGASALRHYLDGTGTPQFLSPDELQRDVPDFRADSDALVADEIRRITEEAQRTGQYGVPVQFTSDWQQFYVSSDMDLDWFLTTREFSHAASGVVVVNEPTVPGGPPQVSADYQVHLYDRYDFDPGDSATVGPITIPDDIPASLHQGGLAQEYDNAGSSAARHYEGPSPAAAGDLPGPPAPPTDPASQVPPAAPPGRVPTPPAAPR